MARLRKAPSAELAAPTRRAPKQDSENATDDDSDMPRTARRRPARKNAPKYAISDDSSAEESEQPAKLVQKSKTVGVKKPAQVRLANLSASDLFSGKPAVEETRRRRRPLNIVEPERVIVPTKSPVESKPEIRESPPVEDVDEEEDVEESIWCQSIDESDASSDSDLPSPRQFLKFPPKAKPKTTKGVSTIPNADFTKQFQALSIFDDDDDTLTAQKAHPKKALQLSRPGSSSDKENNNAIIRFSPPRLKSPSKREPVERPTTPPPPPSPSKGKLQSPSKKALRIPTPPIRQSLDAFWTADTINDWNDQYSPQKPLKSPRKPKLQPRLEEDSPTTSPAKSQSPAKRTKSDLAEKKAFETSKIALAESFLRELDSTITQNQISVLSASTGGVQLIWSRTLNSTAGRANWRRETTKTRAPNSNTITTVHKHFAFIELASKVISTTDRLLNVIAHEFCHLANFMISGVKDQPHGKSFKEWGRKVSRAFGERGVEVTTKHTYEIEYKYIWRCVDEEECGVEFKRHSKSIDPAKHRCGACRGALVQIKPAPRGGGKGTPMLGGIGSKTAATPVTGYAAYVKEHFAAVKKGMPARTTHKEVMEALGKKYRAEKAVAGGVEGIMKGLEEVKLGGQVEVVELD